MFCTNVKLCNYSMSQSNISNMVVFDSFDFISKSSLSFLSQDLDCCDDGLSNQDFQIVIVLKMSQKPLNWCLYVRFLLVANKIQWKIGTIRKGSCAVNAFAFSYQYIDVYTNVNEIKIKSNQYIDIYTDVYERPIQSIHWIIHKCVWEKNCVSLSWFLNRCTNINIHQYLAKISLIFQFKKRQKGDQWRFESRFHWTRMPFRICHHKIIIWKHKNGDQWTFHWTRMVFWMIHFQIFNHMVVCIKHRTTGVIHLK